MDILFSEIADRLVNPIVRDHLLANNLPKIEDVDHYNGQYLEPENHDAYKYPAVFLELAGVTWEDYSQHMQSGLTRVRLHLCMERYASGRQGSRDRSKFLDLLKLPRILNDKLHGFEGTNFTGLLRRNETTDSEYKALYIHIIEYHTIVQDLSSEKSSKYIMSPGGGEVQTTNDQSLV